MVMEDILDIFCSALIKGLDVEPRNDLAHSLLLNSLFPDSAGYFWGDLVSVNWTTLLWFPRWPYVWFLSLYIHALILTSLRYIALCIWAKIMGTSPFFSKQQEAISTSSTFEL